MRINVLKFLALFITLPLIVNLGFSQKDAIGPLLYDQISNPYETYAKSINSFLASDDANSTKTTYSADDFTVPVGETWKINYIEVHGSIDTYAANPDVDSVNVMIYEMSDTADIPGATEAYAASRITSINYKGDGNFIINLPTIATLAEGTYWLCVQPVKNLAEDGYWKWEGQGSGANGFPFHYKNPGLGYYYDAPDWTSGQTLVSSWPSFDLSFALYGPRKDHDLAIEAFSSPVSAPSLDMEDVTITVENRGLVDQSNVDVRYQIDANGWITENIPVTIAAGDTHTFTFSAQADLSAVTDYTITAEVQLAGDEYTDNDSQTWNVTNFGEYYLFTQFDSISTCSGGFADAGGPAGSWTAPMSDTCTIYPVGENTRTRLIFHEFDNGWGQFYIYDGKSPDAPVIDLTPDNVNTVYAYDTDIMDTVTAKNTTGALTIVFDGTSGTSIGWDASIECYTPPADDFEMIDMWTSIPTIFEGQDVDIKAVIYNA
ncbi:MAG TPA: CARDB domain-containing protein, partial [Salinivirga sp.]|uniref:CARDB domain-containing protein n=1 Tax=Salinivirga sp. TaxID=1970192 RepID=UPI002B49578A